MTEFEDTLRDTLRGRAAEAPRAEGLAGGARRRLRRRRTAMATAGVVAAVVVVAPFLVWDRDPGSNDVATDPTSPTASATSTVPDDGPRTESWHDVTFEVPGEWGVGNPTAWCTNAAEPAAATPTVGRPSDVTPMIACSPGQGYGAIIEPRDPEGYFPASGDVWRYQAPEGFDALYPDRSWVGIWYDADVAVTVVTPDRALTEQVVGSVRVVEADGADDNGCPPMLGFAEASKADGSDSLSVCRYDDSDDLEWSRRLSAADATRVRDLLASAPERSIDYDCPTEEPDPGRFAVLDGGAYAIAVVTGASCPGRNGVFRADGEREVTPELAAALERPTS
ncbi:hypothetical protein [Nocardioides currus]|uniref:Uncharacterized protein n=1 Tax=Nocardioides currus TaxID=2133958 RepID=A0A2R7Z0N5_9ACTN|nr:hypothetical protein [Nocardioides currus]PUA81719.1 hypothetical protein C7S10_06515 [Nocardioides currus]